MMSSYMEARHRREGVDIAFGTGVEAFELGDSGQLSALRLTDGRTIAADLALVAIGVVPNAELAQAAGVEVDGGIVVDATLTTADPAVHAIGDCARFPHPLHPSRRLRLESVQNAVDQAGFLAGLILGATGRYESVPWFWSDQYDLKLQIAGVCDAAVSAEPSGDPCAGQFAVSRRRGGELLALETVNLVREHMMARAELKRMMPGAGA